MASVDKMRAILLAPVSKFEKDYPGYSAYLAQQLVNDDWPNTRGKVGVGFAKGYVLRLMRMRASIAQQSHHVCARGCGD